MNKKVRSPFFYVGDKYKLMPQLEKMFPKEINTYFEPFLGGGSSVLYTKAKEYKKEIASLNKQLKKTEIQINSLKKDEKSYEGDLEDIARKRLNMVKPNETVYVDINR